MDGIILIKYGNSTTFYLSFPIIFLSNVSNLKVTGSRFLQEIYT